MAARLLRAFSRDTGAASALEFALILPLLIVILLGSVELHRYSKVVRHIGQAAQTVALLTAQREKPIASREELSFDLNAASIIDPEGEFGWFERINHQISHVVFSTAAGCVQNCAYTANLAWSWPTYSSSVLGPLTRECGAVAAALDNAPASGTAIPGRLFGAGSLVVVDLQYNFTPVFGSSFMSPISIVRQGFASARFAAPHIVLQDGVNTRRCSGY
ncbi:MAG: hypothetical protein JWN93_1068 [Hyphomicrobiales bacterium]|nr:hypothetical protein [Hyphomicrobiales bacterium]